MTPLNAAPSRKEATDNARDMLTDVECFRVIHTDALHPETETTDARKDHRLPFGKFLLQDILQFCDHADHSTFRESTVTACLSRDLVESNLALTHCLRKILPIRTTTLDVVLNQFDVYCHISFC